MLSQADGDAIRVAAPGIRVTVLPVMPEPKDGPRATAGRGEFRRGAARDLVVAAEPPCTPLVPLEEVHPRLPPRHIHPYRGYRGGAATCRRRRHHLSRLRPRYRRLPFRRQRCGGPDPLWKRRRDKDADRDRLRPPDCRHAGCDERSGRLPSFVAIADDAALFARLLAEKVEAAEGPVWTQAALSWSRDRREAFLSALRHALPSSDAAVIAASARFDVAPRGPHATRVST